VTGAERFVDALERLDVRVAFGLPGVHNLPLWKALSSSSIRLVGVRHEQTAVYAADGYARATGELGVALVTTGPGAANTLGATGEAMASGSPVLVVATDIPLALRRPGVYRGVLHETRDQEALFAPLTKHRRTVASADAIGPAVLQAGRRAHAAPSGPAYLGIPTDLLRQAAGPVQEPDRELAAAVPSAAALRAAARLLSTAERPLIWAGGGALRADAGAEVGELALALNAPVVTTYMARGLIPPDHPCAVAGPIHAPEVGPLWDDADVVVAIGSDFDGMMTQNWAMPPPERLIAINVDGDDASKNYVPDVVLAGDARTVTRRLRERVEPRPGLPALRRRLDAVAASVAAAVTADDPEAARFLGALDRVLPDDAIVVADMCIPGYWLGGYRRVRRPRTLAYPVGWGTLGFGFPASLGSALAGTGPTVCVAGDGGFLFACGELATAAQERIPLTVVIVDDGGYGMLRFDQRHAGDEPFGVDLVRPDFERLAAAFGIPAVTVDGFGGEFEAELAAAVAARAPAVIVVRAHLKPPPTTSPRWYRR